MLTAIRRIGPRNYLHFRHERLRDKLRPRRGMITLASHEAQHPLVARAGTSDLSVFSGVFVRRTYAAAPSELPPGAIIDCGANVGFSTAFFLSRYPGRRVLAIEPEPSNFGMLVENLRPYGAAVRLIQSAVWSHPASLVLDDAPYRDGRHWSQRVRPCGPGESPAMVAVDIGSLLAESGHDRIALLKLDVEGAEAVIFASNYEQWIDRVDAMAIELHDDTSFGNATTTLARAIEGRGFAVSRHGEITLCLQAEVKPPAALRAAA